MPKCFAKDRHNDPCRNYAVSMMDGSPRFCKLHQYMNDYTPVMIDAVKLCKGCNKMRYFNTEYNTCEPCRTRDKSKYKKLVIKCAQPECEFKRSFENEYCGKHQLQVFIKSTIDLGKKTCHDHIRGCRVQLDTSYPFSKCRDCLDKESATDRQRRNNAMLASPSNDCNKICTICCKEQELSEFQGFMKSGGRSQSAVRVSEEDSRENMPDDDNFTKTCKTCVRKTRFKT